MKNTYIDLNLDLQSDWQRKSALSESFLISPFKLNMSIAELVYWSILVSST